MRERESFHEMFERIQNIQKDQDVIERGRYEEKGRQEQWAKKKLVKEKRSAKTYLQIRVHKKQQHDLPNEWTNEIHIEWNLIFQWAYGRYCNTNSLIYTLLMVVCIIFMVSCMLTQWKVDSVVKNLCDWYDV